MTSYAQASETPSEAIGRLQRRVARLEHRCLEMTAIVEAAEAWYRDGPEDQCGPGIGEAGRHLYELVSARLEVKP